ncbi:cg30-1 [Spodoptera litura granulovirus]|uniref:Cg30-1 n=1 Tax=Spodoptera litura granulovirus TaxID=359919 RepID=A5IZQ4_9BBAC|nr:cg30-1 [Spodoptera litura granulovirus]ABQ51995.1 cg30-1 [Spodoptera litura granulovirus]
MNAPVKTYIQCLGCRVSGNSITAVTLAYAVPLLQMDICQHMFCVKCIKDMCREDSGSIRCTACDVDNYSVLQRYIIGGELLQIRADPKEIFVYGKLKTTTTTTATTTAEAEVVISDDDENAADRDMLLGRIRENNEKLQRQMTEFDLKLRKNKKKIERRNKRKTEKKLIEHLRKLYVDLKGYMD